MIGILMTLALLSPTAGNSIQLSDEIVQKGLDPISQPAAAEITAAEVVTPLTRVSGGEMRFNMTQDGKKMTAADFDIWMKANGIRIIPAKKQEPTGAGS